MAVKLYSDQIKFSGKGYIDSKMQPVEKIEDLNSIPRSQRFIGLTITVLNGRDGKPTDYWLETSISQWVEKKAVAEMQLNGNDIEM